MPNLPAFRSPELLDPISVGYDVFSDHPIFLVLCSLFRTLAAPVADTGVPDYRKVLKLCRLYGYLGHDAPFVGVSRYCDVCLAVLQAELDRKGLLLDKMPDGRSRIVDRISFHSIVPACRCSALCSILTLSIIEGANHLALATSLVSNIPTDLCSLRAL